MPDVTCWHFYAYPQSAHCGRFDTMSDRLTITEYRALETKAFTVRRGSLLTALLSAFPVSACIIFRGLNEHGLRDAAIVIRGNVTSYMVVTPHRLAIMQQEVSELLRVFWAMKPDVIVAASIVKPNVSGALYKIAHSACHTPGVSKNSQVATFGTS